MRTTILSRSLVAVAALAVGSAALTAVPATAATPTGITRESVLTAASGLRDAIGPSDPSSATNKALRSILHRGCSVDVDGGEVLGTSANGFPTSQGAAADGLVAYGVILNVVDGTARECIVGAVAASSPSYVLSGTATLASSTDPGGTPVSSVVPLAGDVTATALSVAEPGTFSSEPTFAATGRSTKTTVVPAKTVKDKKTKAEKSYSAARRSAKDKYRYATAGYRIVKKATTTKDVHPFDIALLVL